MILFFCRLRTANSARHFTPQKNEDCGGSPHLLGLSFLQYQQQAQGYEEFFIGFFPEEQEQQQ